MPVKSVSLLHGCSFTYPSEWTLTKGLSEKLNKLCIESEKQHRKSKDSHSGQSVEHDEAVHKFMQPLIKDGKLAESTHKVKDMRAWIPQLVMMLYDIRHDDQQRKVKNMWTTRPKDWPGRLNFRDPNNKPKDGSKPNKDELEAVFEFLARKYLTEKYRGDIYPVQETENIAEAESENDVELEQEEEHESNHYWEEHVEFESVKDEGVVTTKLVSDISRLGVSSPEKLDMIPGPQTPVATLVPNATQAEVDGTCSLYDLDQDNIISPQFPALPLVLSTTAPTIVPQPTVPTVPLQMAYPVSSNLVSLPPAASPYGVIYQTNVTYMPSQIQQPWCHVGPPQFSGVQASLLPNGVAAADLPDMVQFSQQETLQEQLAITVIEPSPQQTASDTSYQLSQEENNLLPLSRPERMSHTSEHHGSTWQQMEAETAAPGKEHGPDLPSESMHSLACDEKVPVKVLPPPAHFTTRSVLGMEEDFHVVASIDRVPDVAAHLEVNTDDDAVPPDPRSDVAAYEDIEEQKDDLVENGQIKVPVPMDITSEKVIGTKSVITDVTMPLPSEQISPEKPQESTTGFHAIPATVSDFEPKRKTPPEKKYQRLCHPKKRRFSMSTQT